MARARISAITWTEFLCGPLEPREVGLAARVVGHPLPFTAEDATLAAELYNGSGRRRGTLADCMIAAVALRARCVLLTANPRDFQRFVPFGLAIETAPG